MKKEFHMVNDLKELSRLAEFLENMGEEWEIPGAQMVSLNVALEEALSNTILYGYHDNKEHHISIEITREGTTLSFLIEDDGCAFDPTQRADPDLDLPLEDMPIGGLGIFMIKKIMTVVKYRRENDKNYLLLQKDLEL